MEESLVTERKDLREVFTQRIPKYKRNNYSDQNGRAGLVAYNGLVLFEERFEKEVQKHHRHKCDQEENLALITGLTVLRDEVRNNAYQRLG